MKEKISYTQEQLDIALLKYANEGILRTLSEIKSEIKSNFHWMLGLILGIYALGITGLVSAIGKAYSWF